MNERCPAVDPYQTDMPVQQAHIRCLCIHVIKT